MIKCVMETDVVRYFPESVIHNITTDEDGVLVLSFTRPNGETAFAKVKEFMVLKPGVSIC